MVAKHKLENLIEPTSEIKNFKIFNIRKLRTLKNYSLKVFKSIESRPLEKFNS